MAYSDLNSFDKLCECFSSCMTMEQIAKFALTSKVILSYKIDFLSLFHDQLMKGLWKRSSNGCIYPLDNRCERILYVEINEDYEVNLEKSWEKLKKLSNNIVAQNVYDDVPEPHSSSFKDEIVLSAFGNTQGSKNGGIQGDVGEEELHPNADNMFGELCLSNSRILQEREVVSRVDQVFDEIPAPNSSLNQAQMLCETIPSTSSKEATVYSAHQVFDEVSQPVLNTNRVDDDCTHGHGNEEPQTDAHELYEFKGESDNNFVKDIQHPDAHITLNELPIPSFILEMAQSAKAAELDSNEHDYELGSNDENHVDSLEHNHQMLAKFGALEGSHFRDLVIICSNRMRFSKIMGSLFNDFQQLDKMLHEVNKPYDGTVTSEYRCFEVSMVSSIVSNAIPHIGFINNVVMPLLWSDSDWFMGSSLSVVLGVNVCKSKVFELTYDCRSFFNIKGVHNLEKLNDVISPDVWIVTTAPNAHEVKRLSLFTFIAIVPDNVALTCSQIAWSHFILGCTWFYAHSYTGVFQAKGYYKFFDTGIEVAVSYNTTLEDKGDFRGKEDTNEGCIWKLLHHLDIWYKYNASRANISFVLVSYVFDPGGFSFRVGQVSTVVLDDWFMMLLLFSFKSDSTYSMVNFASIPILEDNDGFLSEYAAAYSSPYDIIMHDSEIIINQATNVHPHMVRFHLQFPTFYKHEMSRLLLGFSHLCFNIVSCKFLASCVTINWEFKEVLYMFEQHYILCILLDLSHKSAIWTIWRGKIVCFDSVWVTRDLAQGVKDVLWRNTIGQIGCESCDRGDAFRLTSNISFLTEMTRIKNRATSSYEFFTEVTFCFFIFGLGGLYNFWIATLKGFMKVATHVESSQASTVWIFYPGGNGNSITCETGLMRGVFSEEAKVRTGTVPKMDLSMLLEYGTHIHYGTIFPFDPGGDDNGLKMTEPPQAYQSGVKQSKNKGYDNFQIYVFDPGGLIYQLLMLYDNLEPESASYALLRIIRSTLFLILEDKDHFKRRVLIHTKI